MKILFDTPNTYIHGCRSLSWLGTGTSIKRGKLTKFYVDSEELYRSVRVHTINVPLLLQ